MDRFASFETYVIVVETGTFSAAARRLKVGQPAVSKSVAQLEEQLGVRLLLRTTRGLTPTEAGLSFYEHARRALDEAEEAEVSARGTSANLRGTLRLGASVTFARVVVIPRLPAFLERHPEMSVDIVLDDRSVNLLAEGVEVALRLGDLDDSSLTAQRIGQGPRVIVCTPAYVARHGAPQTPAQLADHQAILFSRGIGGALWTLRRGETAESVTVSGRISISAAEGVRAAVLADLGIAVASEWMFSSELASGAVIPVLTDWSLAPLDVWAVYPAGRKPTARARAFVAFVRDILEHPSPDH